MSKWPSTWDWLTPTSAKELHSFLELTSYYQRFIPKFGKMPHCLHKLVDPTSNKIKGTKGQKKGGKTIAEPSWLRKKIQMDARTSTSIWCAKEALVTAQVLGY